jgi:Concanavalin A-like lectin/glucanases superfamily
MKKVLWISVFIAVLMGMGIQGASADVTQGLVAHYPFNGDAEDATGNGNDCFVVGAYLTTDANGNSQSAYGFDGSGDYLDCTAGSSLDITDYITVTAWIKPASDLTDWVVIVARWSGVTDQELFGLYTNSLYEVAGEITTLGGGMVKVSNGNVVTPGEWQHVGMVYDTVANTFTLYRNGVQLWQWGGLYYGGTPQMPTVDNNLTIGAVKREALYNYFDGSIDDVRIYNRALTESEMVELYANGSSDGIDPDGGETCTNGGSGSVSSTLDIHLPSLIYTTPLGTMDIWVDLEYYGEGPNGEILWKLKEYGQN